MATDALTREQVRERLRRVEAEVFGLGVRRLALFGSVLRNEALPDSDVDFLVEFIPGQKSFDRFLALSDLLETLLGPVELVTTEALSPFLGPHILAEAEDVLRDASSCLRAQLRNYRRGGQEGSTRVAGALSLDRVTRDGRYAEGPPHPDPLPRRGEGTRAGVRVASANTNNSGWTLPTAPGEV